MWVPFAARTLACVLLASCCGAGILGAAGPAEDPPDGQRPHVEGQRPNVLFIAIDDLNDWIGCLDGHRQAKTPNIDRLAARGLLFANAHCAAPACNPSRAAVFSGLYPSHTGVWSNDSERLLRKHPHMLVLPRVFQKAGYVTLGTGKLLHSSGSTREVFERSFVTEQRWSPFSKDAVQYRDDELPTKGTSDPRHVVKLDASQTVVLPLNGMPSDRRPNDPAGESFDWGPMDVDDSAMGDTQITDWAIEQLDQGFDRPFFLGVGYYRPHIPLWAPKEYFERFENQSVILPPVNQNDLADLSPLGRRWAVEAVTAGLHQTVIDHQQWQPAVAAYLACTTFVDHQIGRLLDALDRREFGDNTVIVLWTDHGWHLGEKQHWGKWTGWERSTHVPLIMVPPQKEVDHFAQAGSRCDAPVSLIDLYPTLTDLCRVDAPDHLDGQSLVPLLRAPAKPTDRVAVTMFDRGNVSVRSEHVRYIRYADGSEELYDHRHDPHEWVNLVDRPAYAERLESLRQRFADAASETD